MRLVPIASAISALLLGLSSAGAQANTIADWTFETSQPGGSAGITEANFGPALPESGTGQASGHHASSAAVYSTPAGNGSPHSFSSNNWATGDYYQFSVSTLGETNVDFSWDQTGSSTGPKDFTLAYSLDGTNFTSLTNYSVQVNGSPNSPWSGTSAVNPIYTLNEDLSSITALDNQAQVYFRLVDRDTSSLNGGTVATAGTDRVDNVMVSASPVPLPAAAWLFGSGFAMLAGLRRKRISA